MNFAHLNTAELDALTKFARVMKKAGADFTGPMQDTTQRRSLVSYLESGCPKVSSGRSLIKEIDPVFFARSVLEKDFITPEMVAEVSGLSYSEEQRETLEKAFPSLNAIAWCKSNNAILTPTPPEVLSLIDLMKLKPEWFYENRFALFRWQCSSFAFEDKIKETSWLMLRKESLPGSVNENWEKQLALLSKKERVPNITEFFWGVKMARTGKDIFENRIVRTASKGKKRIVGCLAYRLHDIAQRKKGLELGCRDDDECYENVGITSVYDDNQ